MMPGQSFLQKPPSHWRQTLQRHNARLQPHFPLSMAGLAVAVLAVLALQGFGYRRMDLVVFALTVCALSIVTFSVIMVTCSGLILRKRLRSLSETALPAIQAEAGHPNDTGFNLPALPWLPLMTLHWRVIAPDAIATNNRPDPDLGRVDEEITPQRRCRSKELTRLFTLQDVLGLARFSWRANQGVPLQVLPQTGRLRALPVLRSMDAEDGIPSPSGLPEGDRMDIRRYAAGDSVRNIMWRVYARNRHLNVRLPEKSVFHADRTLAYLLTGPDDEAAAGVSRFALSHGALGAPWVFGADGSDDTATTVSAALPLIAGSRVPGQAAVYGLDGFLARMGQQHSACIIFAPASPGAWTTALQATLSRHAGPFSIVFATDGMIEDAPNPLWRRILMNDPGQPRHGNQISQLRKLLQDFGKRGAHVVMVDRQTGLCFDQRLKRV